MKPLVNERVKPMIGLDLFGCSEQQVETRLDRDKKKVRLHHYPAPILLLTDNDSLEQVNPSYF